MKMLGSRVLVVALACVLSACSASKPPLNTSGLDNIEALHRAVDTTATGAPTVAQYQSARDEFLAAMRATMDQQRRESGSALRTAKHVIVGVGAAVGLGGMIASFIVDDDDTKTTIAQASGGVAGVSGIVGLLPLGSQPAGGDSVRRYLELELPVFEARWPHDISQALTADEWRDFKRDAEQMQTVVKALSK